MDYKKVKQEDGAIKRREKILKIFAAVLAGTVAVQAITICILLSYNGKYNSLYDESLETQRSLYQTIENFKSGTGEEDAEKTEENSDGENTENTEENSDGENTENIEKNSDGENAKNAEENEENKSE